MKRLLTEQDANALFSGVAFISIDKANRIINERLKERATPKPKKQKPRRAK